LASALPETSPSHISAREWYLGLPSKLRITSRQDLRMVHASPGSQKVAYGPFLELNSSWTKHVSKLQFDFSRMPISGSTFHQLSGLPTDVSLELICHIWVRPHLPGLLENQVHSNFVAAFIMRLTLSGRKFWRFLNIKKYFFKNSRKFCHLFNSEIRIDFLYLRIIRWLLSPYL
jgi:hypothetical protein